MKVIVTRTLAGGVDVLANEQLITELWVAPPGIGPVRKELLERVSGAQAVLCQFCERIDSEFYDAAGPQLKIVANYAVGFENLDIKQATARGIWITNTPDTVTPATADMAWALMLAISRRIIEGDKEVRSGVFANRSGYDPCHMLGGDFENKTLLIVGAGRIGYATALRSIGWNMNVLYVARNRHPEFEKPPVNAMRVSLETGLKKADYVSLHTPLTDETYHLISSDELDMMKESAYLINTARGPVVDEAALVEALRAGRIAGAGLDVFEDEPHQHPGLVELPNTCLMPHVGSASLEQRPMMARMAQQNIVAALHDEVPPNALNCI